MTDIAPNFRADGDTGHRIARLLEAPAGWDIAPHPRENCVVVVQEILQ